MLELSGDTERSLQSFAKAIEINPKYGSAYESRARIYRKQKKYDCALAEMDAYIREISEPKYKAPAYRVRAIILQESGDNEGAIKGYGKAIEFDPNYVAAYEARAKLYRDAKKYDLALVDANVAIEKATSPSAYSYWLRGDILEKMDKKEAALADYTKAIEIDSKYVTAYVYRAALYRKAKEYDLALKDIDAALENAHSPTVYQQYLRGVILQDRGDDDAAIEAFTKAIEIDPNYSFAYGSRSVIYKNLKKYDLALQDINVVIEYLPSPTAYYYWIRGDIWEKSGKKEAALIDYTKAIELDPKYVWAYVCRADLYKAMKKYDLALKDIDLAIKNSSSPSTYHYWLRGDILEKSGEREGAIGEYSKALEIDPKADYIRNARRNLYRKADRYDLIYAEFDTLIKEAATPKEKAGYYLQRGQILLRNEDRESALREYTQAIEVDPSNNDAYKARAFVYRLMKKYDLALADEGILIKIASTAKEKAEHHQRRGSLLQDIGNIEDALKDYTTAIELDPNNSFAYSGRLRIYSKLGKHNLALADGEAMVRKSPKSYVGYYERGQIYYQMEKIDLAAHDFKKALELATTDIRSAYWLGEIYEIHYKDKEKALDYYRLVANSKFVYATEYKKAEGAIQRLEGQ